MTPNALLERVKAQFVLLLHDEPDKLEALLVQALNEYQDRAGAMQQVDISLLQQQEGGIAVPPYLLTVVSATDTDQVWHETTIRNDKLNVVPTRLSSPPFTVDYLVALSEFDLDSDELPRSATGMLQKYLRVLIEIPNTEREIYMRTASDMPLDGLYTLSELHERKKQLEDEMELSANMLLPSMILQ